MKLEAILLLHDDPANAERLISLLLAGGVDVVVHIDRKAGRALETRLREAFRHRRVAFARRMNAQWGTYALVRAALNALDTIRRLDWRPDYVTLLSGSDFPIRSADALRDFLAAHRGLDFIESKPISVPWVRGGLQVERFEHYFFLDWRRRKRLFNLAYRAQRAVTRVTGPRRRSAGVALHLGSQWWTLRWSTCAAILDLIPERPDLVRFFRWAWIPDESFFQTLVRLVRDADEVADANLTYYEFDELGRPLVLYDDHAEHLRAQPYFFARKLSPRAQRLRDELAARWLGSTDGAGLPAVRVPTPAFTDFCRLDRHGPRGMARAGLVYDQTLGALDCNIRPYVALLAPPSSQTTGLAQLVTEHTPVRLCGRVFGRDVPEFHPEVARRVAHLRGMVAMGRLDPMAYWAEVLALAGDEPIGLVLCRVDAPALFQAVVNDPVAIKIVFRPHPGDVWSTARAQPAEQPSRGDEQDRLDHAMHLSWDHERARAGRGTVYVLETAPWRRAPDGVAVSRVLAALGAPRMDPGALERRLAYEPAVEMTDAERRLTDGSGGCAPLSQASLARARRAEP